MATLTPQLRPKAAYKKQLPNVRTNPGKIGGYGYADITLSKYPPNMSDPFDTSHDVYMKNYVRHVKKKRAGPLYPPTYPRPYFDTNPYYTEKPVPTYKSVPRTRAKLRGPGKFLPTSPTKMEGGCKAGCFDKFPAYTPSPFEVKPKRSKGGRPAGKLPFYPSQGVKPYPQHSIVSHNVDLAVNAGNWQHFQPIVYP
uniref:Cilia-and flagella-associated protein 96 n=1 Tax=Timema californicum TaxID=61474 RepID=A0A7R9J0I4_TIMCA|nr:unnamed protein product [Timema californicum]